jgi:hypothetical protein
MNPYVFGKGEEEEIYLGRADDLMQRNLDRRVEQLFPCARRDKVRRLLKLQLAHTVKACELKRDGSFVRLHPRRYEEPLDSQELLLEAGLLPWRTTPLSCIFIARMATGVSKMGRSLLARRFGSRSEEFVAKNHLEVERQLEATDLDLAESWLKKRSPTWIQHSSYKAGG